MEQEKIKAFDMNIKDLYGEYDKVPPKDVKANILYTMDDEEEFDSILPETEAPFDAGGKNFNMQPLYDNLVKAKIRMPHNVSMRSGTVVGRTIDDDGKVYGTYDDNPYRNTVAYDVEFQDGRVKEYSASLIADNMYAQVDREG